MTDIDGKLREVLERRADEVGKAPPSAPPEAVLRRVRRRQVGMVLVAGIVAAGVTLGGFATVRSMLPLQPVRPAGDASGDQVTSTERRAVLASGDHEGRHWKLVVYEGASGWCVDIEVGDGSAGGCDISAPREHMSVGVSGFRGDPVFVSGVLSKDVRDVQVVLENGRVFRPEILTPPSGLDAPFNVFLVVFDEPPAGRVVAFDETGKSLADERIPSFPDMRDVGETALSCVPSVDEPPCAAGVRIGEPYPYRLYTHCGIHDAFFDGRWWIAQPPLDDGSGNPPPGWGNPHQVGRMMLVAKDEAVFRAGKGRTARFVPAAPGYDPQACS